MNVDTDASESVLVSHQAKIEARSRSGSNAGAADKG